MPGRRWNLKVTKLTDYERDILELVAQGHTGPEIGSKLGKPHTSIATALVRIRRKLGARTTTHAAVIAVRNNLL